MHIIHKRNGRKLKGSYRILKKSVEIIHLGQVDRIPQRIAKDEGEIKIFFIVCQFIKCECKLIVPSHKKHRLTENPIRCMKFHGADVVRIYLIIVFHP
ncbi:hypothetical protein SDC9_122848 [bioreactor metagenome]|uniref:Uncharacterized protein n=1 Tax=bioreactor metagenome TaxID=1076179 RepID=A0A645CFX7_9ZZZZ